MALAAGVLSHLVLASMLGPAGDPFYPLLHFGSDYYPNYMPLFEIAC